VVREHRPVDRGLAVILTVVVGALIALQPPVNAGLGRVTGNVAAAFVSFLIGTLLLAVLVALAAQADGLRSTFDVEWIYLTGGILGVAYVFTVLVTVSTIGAGGVAAATITGQLTASIVIDRLGILGLEEQALTVERLLGVGLLLAGTYLVVR
jgi:transporter family-2 protein